MPTCKKPLKPPKVVLYKIAEEHNDPRVRDVKYDELGYTYIALDDDTLRIVNPSLCPETAQCYQLPLLDDPCHRQLICATVIDQVRYVIAITNNVHLNRHDITRYRVDLNELNIAWTVQLEEPEHCVSVLAVGVDPSSHNIYVVRDGNNAGAIRVDVLQWSDGQQLQNKTTEWTCDGPSIWRAWDALFDWKRSLLIVFRHEKMEDLSSYTCEYAVYNMLDGWKVIANGGLANDGLRFSMDRSCTYAFIFDEKTKQFNVCVWDGRTFHNQNCLIISSTAEIDTSNRRLIAHTRNNVSAITNVGGGDDYNNTRVSFMACTKLKSAYDLGCLV
jgi:hypothetical protein